MRHNNEINHFKFSPSTWIVPTFLLVVIWFVFYVENSFNIDLGNHGILPRTFSGLQGDGKNLKWINSLVCLIVTIDLSKIQPIII